MKTIAFTHLKGGVGKTTSCVRIGERLFNEDYGVLCVDFTPDADLTKKYKVKPECTIYDVISKKIPVKQAIAETTGPDLLPSSTDLYNLVGENTPGKDFMLQEVLAVLEDYDYILIDCPPMLDPFLINSCVCADLVVVPEQFDMGRNVLDVNEYLLNKLILIKKRLNPALGILVASADNVLGDSIYEKVRELDGIDITID